MKMAHVKSVKVPITKPSADQKFAIGNIYGSGDIAIIFSNMDTNDQNEWNPIVKDLVSERYMGITYNYPEQLDDQSKTLESVISFVCDLGVKKIVLIGASRGGVASIKVAAQHVSSDSIVGLVALSAPIEYEGTVFYSNGELSRIKIPKLLLNSKKDGGADDNLKMLEIFKEPKKLLLYQGDAHGTQLFDEVGESILKEINNFVECARNLI